MLGFDTLWAVLEHIKKMTTIVQKLADREQQCTRQIPSLITTDIHARSWSIA